MDSILLNRKSMKAPVISVETGTMIGRVSQVLFRKDDLSMAFLVAELSNSTFASKLTIPFVDMRSINDFSVRVSLSSLENLTLVEKNYVQLIDLPVRNSAGEILGVVKSAKVDGDGKIQSVILEIMEGEVRLQRDEFSFDGNFLVFDRMKDASIMLDVEMEYGLSKANGKIIEVKEMMHEARSIVGSAETLLHNAEERSDHLDDIMKEISVQLNSLSEFLIADIEKDAKAADEHASEIKQLEGTVAEGKEAVECETAKPEIQPESGIQLEQEIQPEPENRTEQPVSSELMIPLKVDDTESICENKQPSIDKLPLVLEPEVIPMLDFDDSQEEEYPIAEEQDLSCDSKESKPIEDSFESSLRNVDFFNLEASPLPEPESSPLPESESLPLSGLKSSLLPESESSPVSEPEHSALNVGLELPLSNDEKDSAGTPEIESQVSETPGTPEIEPKATETPRTSEIEPQVWENQGIPEIEPQTLENPETPKIESQASEDPEVSDSERETPERQRVILEKILNQIDDILKQESSDGSQKWNETEQRNEGNAHIRPNAMSSGEKKKESNLIPKFFSRK